MATTDEIVDLDALRAAVARQGAKVREIKKSGGNDLADALDKLKALKIDLAEAAKSIGSDIGETLDVDRGALEMVLLRRMFVVPSFEIYGGVRGFYDFGPPGCALKTNLIALWKQHFVLEEKMQEIECTNLMPHPVLSTSGHVERFCDLMVKDTKTGECFRGDKILEEHIEKLLTDGTSRTSEEILRLERIARQADAWSPTELDGIFKDLGIISPLGNPFTESFPFNLMFKSTIGPEGTMEGYLRPETAQGIFINFPRLLDCNYGKMPFAAAQVGQAYRNEIAPRNGLLRVREFCQAEIEHFVHPEKKDHAKFFIVADDKLKLFPADKQLGDGQCLTDVTLGQAVTQGIINNQTLAYFIGRCASFLIKAGIQSQYLRFRQHLKTEMAHYASDCWDAEILTSYGWVECVGIADRACYDLQCHGKATNTKMNATYIFPDGPREVVKLEIKFSRKDIGKAFKKSSKIVTQALQDLLEDEEKAMELETKLENDGEADIETSDGVMKILRPMVKYFKVKKKVQEEKYVPSVIEPSFGIGRIMYSILEQSFVKGVGGDQQRTALKFTPAIAPTKCAVLPLSGNKSFRPIVATLGQALTKLGIENKIDESSTAIGRRYARMDEVGVPFALTVDFNTVGYEGYDKDGCVTLRERDSQKQLRLSMLSAPAVVNGLVRGHFTFESLLTKYPVVSGGGNEVKKAKLYGGTNIQTLENVIVESSNPDGRRLLFSRPVIKK